MQELHCTTAEQLRPLLFESALQTESSGGRGKYGYQSLFAYTRQGSEKFGSCLRNNATIMLVVGDGIRSSLVIPASVRSSSSSSSSSSFCPAAAAVAIVEDGGRVGKKKKKTEFRGRIAVDVKCTASQQGVGAHIVERKAKAPVVTEIERRSTDDELALPALTSTVTAVEIPDSRFESGAHQLELEISLHDLGLSLPTHSPELLSEDGEGHDESLDLTGSSAASSFADGEESASISDESSIATPQPQQRPKKIWQGIRRPRRVPPQPPWSADDFTLRAKLILESILTESSSSSERSHRLLVEDILNSWLGKITRIELTKLMKDLGFRRQPSLALEVFFWMQKQKGRLKPSPHVYSAIIGMLGRAGMVSQARNIFDSQQVRSLQSVHIYNSIMGAYLKRGGNFKRAWKLYAEMCDRGLEADEVTFNTLLSGVSRADMPLKTAEKLFSEMKLAGISPGRYTYNTLILVFSKFGNLEGAAALLDEMRAAEQTPDLCTYNTVIGMYGHAGKYEEALKVYGILKAAGFSPDVVTYTHLMQMFNRAQNLEAAVGQFSEMQRVGGPPDLMAYSLLVHIYGRAGLAAEAEQAFKRMQEAGFKPNIVTWSSLIQAYGKTGMLEKVSSCFAEMLKCGCRPDASLFNIMMSAYRQAELPTHAASLFRRMRSQGIEPNAACFNTLIRAFSESGQREDAKAWHEQMVRSGFAPDKLSRRLLNNLSPTRGKHRNPHGSQTLHSIRFN